MVILFVVSFKYVIKANWFSKCFYFLPIFSLEGVQVDGNVTLGENIADHGGLRIAEIAYENWLNKNNGFDASLPALENFSPFQLFYLGYALPWCAVHSDSMLRHQVCMCVHFSRLLCGRSKYQTYQNYTKPTKPMQIMYQV